MPEPDVVIIVDVPPERAESRMTLRDEGYPESFRNFTIEAMLSNLERVEQLLDMLNTHISDAPVIRIDNTIDIDTVESNLKQALTQEMGHDLWA